MSAGMAIIALQTLAQDPTCDIKICAVGLHYYHPDQFRSQACIEFSLPIHVDDWKHLVPQFQKGGPDKRAAVSEMLELMSNVSATLTEACFTSLDYYELYQL